MITAASYSCLKRVIAAAEKIACLLWVVLDHVHMKDHINQLQRVISCSRGADSPSFKSHVTSATHRQADFLRAL